MAMAGEKTIKLINDSSEEMITPGKSHELLSYGKVFVAYDGFEPSGKMHIAQTIIKTAMVNEFSKLDIQFKVLVADWHARANKKLDGSLDKIQVAGRYFTTFASCEELEKSFVEKKLHPFDLKEAVAQNLNVLLEPIRSHFENDKNAHALKEKVKSFMVTR